MNISIVTDPYRDVAMLRALDFRGFRSVSHLHRTGCLDVPVESGVYAVVRDTEVPPEFLTHSAAGRFRHQDPSVTVDELETRWVKGASVLFIGSAPGPGVRSLLQQRVKRDIRFGLGKAVAHSAGRFIWQLRDHLALRVAWLPLPDEDPANMQTSLLNGFFSIYQRFPFANLVESPE